MAHHWKRAEEPEKAIQYYMKAAETAMSGFEHRLATSLLLNAVSLHEYVPESEEV